MLDFPEQLKEFRDLHGLTDTELGNRLGLRGGSHVGQIIRREKGWSKQVERALHRLKREEDLDAVPAWLERLGKEGIEGLKALIQEADEKKLEEYRKVLKALRAISLSALGEKRRERANG